MPEFGVAGGGGQVELLQHVVAQGDRLADGREAHAVLGQARHGGGPGDRAGGHHQDVVPDFGGQSEFAARRRVHPGGAGGVVDPGDPGGEHPAVGERGAQRHDDVARVDGTGRDLGQQRLERQVGLRLDDRQLDPAVPQPGAQQLLETQRGAQSGAAAADDQDSNGAPPAALGL